MPGVRCTVLGTATGRSSQGAGSKRTLHHVRLKEGSEATICRKYSHEEIAGKGTDHEHTYYSCDGCPFNVEKFGEHKICGCILSGPDDWDEPKVIGHIVRTIIREMAGGKK